MSDQSDSQLPVRFDGLKTECLRIFDPLRQIDSHTVANRNFLVTAHRTEAGRKLPPHYLVYFLLVELLGFRNLGHFEKVAYSIPVDFNGKAFLVEYRKSGLGLFCQDIGIDESDSELIVNRIRNAVNRCASYFTWLASEAQSRSELNVHNHSKELFDRFDFFVQEYHRLIEATKNGEEQLDNNDGMARRLELLNRNLSLARSPNWIANAAIEAFYSWTEHVFILIGILQGKLLTGDEVASAANSNWSNKFKIVFDITDGQSKHFYDELLRVRRQLRNYVAHGAFGKSGEAFTFHSRAGAVPIVLAENASGQPKLGGSLAFDEPATLEMIFQFVKFLWAHEREPAKIYCQESGLPLILPYASDGTYKKAMDSVQEMERFSLSLGEQFDQAANMEW